MDIIAFLEQEQIFENVKDYKDSGSLSGDIKTYEVSAKNGKFTVKHAKKENIKSEEAWSAYENEWLFFSLFKDAKLTFLPKIVYMSRKENVEILMVFNSYERIPHIQWTHRLQLNAVDLCARLNSIDINFMRKMGLEYKQTATDKESLDNSYQEWQYVLNSYGARFGGNILKRIYEKFDKICEIINAPPYNICHGNFSPDNILINYDGENAFLVLSDWKNINIGKGINDISFFISRSRDFDIKIEDDALITYYCERLSLYSDKTIEKSDIYKIKNSFTVMTSFLYWPFYLINSDAKRVAVIYDEMAKAFLSLSLL